MCSWACAGTGRVSGDDVADVVVGDAVVADGAGVGGASDRMTERMTELVVGYPDVAWGGFGR